MMWGNWTYGTGMEMFGGFLMLLFWIVLIVLVVSFFRRSRGMMRGDAWSDRSKEDTAVTLLRERYARGDITKEEFDEKLKVLQ